MVGLVPLSRGIRRSYRAYTRLFVRELWQLDS